MMGQSVIASDLTMDSRMYIYEVEGLSRNDQTYKATSPIRNSGALLFSVSHSRMSAFMKKMNRLGGKITAIHSSWDAAMTSEPVATDEGNLEPDS